ncbi:hypothetical protein OsI_34503 [Oryza sativa Indica Group]|uniref:Uncharacterized protein n=1 Tax=Oryza sativa subsp. indica TaxID=39946 RepID=B8BI23_ORYSI|nr:hypothetical protein OsI_34503 [Oryza sativa Indica Group]
MEELRVSYYADTDEETREQLKQFWDDEFNAISSGETTIERDLKWMRKEVIEAFETYSHCHGCRNSGIDLKHPSNGGYEEGNAYSGLSFDDDEFDAISEETTKEKGHCHGCRNSGIDLKHPSNGGYEEGNADSGFSFDPI